MQGARRAIDASLNRAAEALRVAEDLCRFDLELPGFCRDLRDLRHEVLDAFAPGPDERRRLAEARDIEEDVGKSRHLPLPEGAGPRHVLTRNLERAKEALRSLEEVGRLLDATAAARAAEIRYRLYSVEKGVLSIIARPPGGGLAGVRLYLLATEGLSRLPLPDAVEAAVRGGVQAVQLRAKGAPDRRTLELGLVLRELTATLEVPLIVNDRPDLAAELNADGVHLGQDDLPVAAARRILGEGKLVGVSTHAPEEARRAAREGADYIGAGPVFPTSTKEVGPPLGPEGLRSILEACDLPVFAVGGIRAENVGLLVKAGARRAAVASGILSAGDAEAIARAAGIIAGALGGSATTEGSPPGLS